MLIFPLMPVLKTNAASAATVNARAPVAATVNAKAPAAIIHANPNRRIANAPAAAT